MEAQGIIIVLILAVIVYWLYQSGDFRGKENHGGLYGQGVAVLPNDGRPMHTPVGGPPRAEHYGGLRHHFNLIVPDDGRPNHVPVCDCDSYPCYHCPASMSQGHSRESAAAADLDGGLGEGPLPTPGRSGYREHYGEPPGMIRAVHQDELGYRGWADNPGDFEGSSASALSAYVDRSA
jgi:hypothetical protein